ncbi:MAG: hypothetical protein HOJ16_00425 [Candidatus Peribacter sp.]|jgi:hypothetical protein|nr:hypothetical protein [Candidatus Peribacter sp.]
MKIYINRQPKQGPWGGGIKTVNKLVKQLSQEGHTVCFRLEENIDVIFCIDPRPNDYGEWYQHFINYRNANPNTRIIQRVGDLGTHSKPELTKLVAQTLEISDFMIFPSEWARDWIGFKGDNCEVVHNAPMSIFYANRQPELDISNRPRLVTHHWSKNPKKGFHFYSFLQNHIDKTFEFDFRYIGRLPEEVLIKNHTAPIAAIDLSLELPKSEIYITASIEEAGANHVVEALGCGLPIVYHDEGGSINNYCKDYGESFNTFESLLESVRLVASSYSTYKNRAMSYDRNNDDVVSKYLEVINNI